MSQRYKDNYKKATTERKSAKGFKILHILSESLAEGLGSRRQHWWGYIFIYENTL